MRPSLDLSPPGKARGVVSVSSQTLGEPGSWLQLTRCCGERLGGQNEGPLGLKPTTCSHEEAGPPGLAGVALAKVPISPP